MFLLDETDDLLKIDFAAIKSFNLYEFTDSAKLTYILSIINPIKLIISDCKLVKEHYKLIFKILTTTNINKLYFEDIIFDNNLRYIIKGLNLKKTIRDLYFYDCNFVKLKLKHMNITNLTLYGPLYPGTIKNILRYNNIENLYTNDHSYETFRYIIYNNFSLKKIFYIDHHNCEHKLTSNDINNVRNNGNLIEIIYEPSFPKDNRFLKKIFARNKYNLKQKKLKLKNIL